MQRLVNRGLIFGIGLVVLTIFVGPLLRPGSILVLRDVPNFHVPLRSTFADLAAEGLPSWNPRIHGGQPILSNPNYASFYPPTWLSLALPAHRAIAWLLVFHAAFGFAGAWLAARRFGCRQASATLTAVAFIGGGSVWSALNLFFAITWLPWTLYWGHRCFTRADQPLTSRHTALTGLALAMQLLAGEPAIALASSLAIACLALTAPNPLARRLKSLGAVALFAVLFSAVQLLPTMDRLRGSARVETSQEESSVWSTPPLRLLELAFPRLYGDPMKLDDDFYFGWTLHDRNFPYLISIYAGQLVLLLAFSALVRWPIPLRLFWAAFAIVGLALALGRYNPLYLQVAPSLPFLKLLRYPEKFLVLTTTALAFTAGLGWQHILDKRNQNGPAREDFPLTLAAALAVVALVFCLTLSIRPEVAGWFVRESTIHPPQGERLAAAVSYLVRQAWIGLAVSLVSVTVLALHRIRAIPVRVLIPLTLIALGGDLVFHNGGLTPTIPYEELAHPPAHLAAIDPAGGRVFTDQAFIGRDGFQPRSTRPGPDSLWSSIDRAEPYLGNLWGYSYALHQDFDNMLTEPGRRTLSLLARHWSDTDIAHRILGSWGVGYVLRNRSVAELTRARLSGRDLPPVDVETLAWRNPILSWERTVQWHDTVDEAEAEAALTRFRSAQWVGSPKLGASTGGAPDEIQRLEAKSASTVLEYTSRSVLLAVVNTTFDRGWHAQLDGRDIPVHRTVLGQIALELPPGHHVLDLRFRTPYLGVGMALTLFTMLAVLAAEVVRRRSSVLKQSQRIESCLVCRHLS
ncbi:MAG: YfhO family protein [Acidobacteria bacterium]|nr:YfhO family protein [Acidobacteriota bacterium]